MTSKTKSFLQDERAVSTVIGFVLLMGIVLSASTIYFSSQVPEWTKDFESLHTDDVTDDFAELKSLIDSIVLKGEGGALAAGSIPIKMAPDKVPILGMSPSGSNLQVLPDDKTFLVTPTVEGAAPPAAPGSSYWEENSFTDPDATYYRMDNSSNELKLAKITYDYPDLILDSPTEAERLGDVQYFDQVAITNGGTLYVAGAGFLKLCANNITVGPGGKITADGKGYWGGTTEKDGSGVGGGEAGGTDSGGGGGGAGYGDDGGDGNELGGDGGDGGDDYGDATSNSSIQQGSGGGGGGIIGSEGATWLGGSGGNGGGAIWLDAEEINIAGGTISANGGDGNPAQHLKKSGGGGGGTGGGILIKGRNVTISGNLSAKGGTGGKGGNGGGGGAGGRIKIFNESGSISLTHEIPTSGSNASGEEGGAGGNASIYTYEENYTSAIPCVEDGYYISEVYDTGNASTCYGNMTRNADLNGQRIVMRVRTSMVEEMEGNATLWENCPAVSSGEDVSDLTSASDGHRYIQYRAELYTEDTYMTPVLHSVRINYSYSAPGGGSPILAISSGIIKFNSNYLYYPNQQIVYEHGAVIKWQHEGGFMLHEPPINISKNITKGFPIISISMVDLTGSNRSYSGATSTSLKNTYQSYNLHADSLKYPNLTINVTTAYPSVWEKWFNKTIQEKGLVYGVDKNYTIYYYPPSPAPAEKVVVEFYGHGDGVELYLEKTAVEVEI
jgi:hypothetical protein